MEYKQRKKQLDLSNEDTLRGLILEKEGFTKRRESYLKKLNKKQLIQVLLSVEFGNTCGYEPVEFKKKTKTKKAQDGEGSS
jgi:hypothetical protein